MYTIKWPGSEPSERGQSPTPEKALRAPKPSDRGSSTRRETLELTHDLVELRRGVLLHELEHVVAHELVRLAHEAGLFKKHGLSEDLILISGGATNIQALLAGEIQFANAAGSACGPPNSP